MIWRKPGPAHNIGYWIDKEHTKTHSDNNRRLLGKITTFSTYRIVLQLDAPLKVNQSSSCTERKANQHNMICPLRVSEVLDYILYFGLHFTFYISNYNLYFCFGLYFII